MSWPIYKLWLECMIHCHVYVAIVAEWQVMCIFKALHRRPQDQYHGLDLEEFQRFYEVIDFKWEQVLYTNHTCFQESLSSDMSSQSICVVVVVVIVTCCWSAGK